MLAEGTRLPNATFSTNTVASYIFPDSSHAMYSQEFLRPQNSQALRISTFAQNSVRLPRLTDALLMMFREYYIKMNWLTT